MAQQKLNRPGLQHERASKEGMQAQAAPKIVWKTYLKGRIIDSAPAENLNENLVDLCYE
jgi:hypothetical protein